MNSYNERTTLLGDKKFSSDDDVYRLEASNHTIDNNVKTYSPVVAFAFCINFIIGAGVMGLPYAYEKAGVVLSGVFMMFTGTLMCVTMTYIMEACARAEGLVGSVGTSSPPLDLRDRFIITNRKFEINELCGIFLSVRVGAKSIFYRFADDLGRIRLGQRAYEFSLFWYTLGSMWLYGTIFASSLTITVPLPFLEQYSLYTSTHNVTSFDPAVVCKDVTSSDNPEPYCESAYNFFLMVYGGFMIPLSCFDLSGQIAVQMSLTFLGILVILIMSVTCVGGMFSTPQPGSSSTMPYMAVGHIFNPAGFGKIFSTAIFSQLGHQGVPGLVQLVRNKKKVKGVFISAVATTAFLFIAMSTLTSLYFGNNILNVVTMHWKSYTGGAAPGEPVPIWASVISYLVVLFPIFTVSAAFPLNGITLADNLAKSVPSSFTNFFGARAIECALRIVIATLPICGAGYLRNITKILEVCGLLAFLLAFWIPCLLMHYSRVECVNRWGPGGEVTPYHWWFSKPTVVTGIFALSLMFFGITLGKVIDDLVLQN
eukprot:Nk52_evm5s2657 gene=Nk52_evmTU5s2657